MSSIIDTVWFSSHRSIETTRLDRRFCDSFYSTLKHELQFSCSSLWEGQSWLCQEFDNEDSGKNNPAEIVQTEDFSCENDFEVNEDITIKAGTYSSLRVRDVCIERLATCCHHLNCTLFIIQKSWMLTIPLAHVSLFFQKTDGGCLPVLHRRNRSCPISLCPFRRNFPLQFLSLKFFLSHCPLCPWRWVLIYINVSYFRNISFPFLGYLLIFFSTQFLYGYNWQRRQSSKWFHLKKLSVILPSVALSYFLLFLVLWDNQVVFRNQSFKERVYNDIFSVTKSDSDNLG